jgi:hypothetical protein
MAQKPEHLYEEKGSDNEGLLHYISFNMRPDKSSLSLEEYRLACSKQTKRRSLRAFSPTDTACLMYPKEDPWTYLFAADLSMKRN